jgi:hypothetical protein
MSSIIDSPAGSHQVGYRCVDQILNSDQPQCSHGTGLSAQITSSEGGQAYPASKVPKVTRAKKQPINVQRSTVVDRICRHKEPNGCQAGHRSTGGSCRKSTFERVVHAKLRRAGGS